MIVTSSTTLVAYDVVLMIGASDTIADFPKGQVSMKKRRNYAGL